MALNHSLQRCAVWAFFLTIAAGNPAFARSTKPKSPKSTATQATRTRVTSEPVPVGPAQRWLRGMTLRDKVAQLVVLTTYGEAPSSRSPLFKKYAHAVRDLRVGGLIVVNRVVAGSVRNAEPFAMAAFLNRMQRLAKVPLIVGADFERGASMRVSGTTKFPHLMAYGAARDLTLTRALGQATAEEARALGVHWVFAPVADVNNNPDNPIINIRSFGEKPEDVTANVRAYIEGAHSAKNRVLATVKHFPGHGDTSVDSHMGLASLRATRERMQALELAPFRGAIQAGVDAVMTAHMAVPAVEPEEIPATVSKRLLTALLRSEMGFTGLIVTDAMDMQGLTKQFPGGEAAVRAIEAGADVLLMPPNPEIAIESVVAAVKAGRITEKRIQESVLRILMAKARVGLHRGALVDLESVSDVLESAEFAEQAQTAANKAITMVKNDRGTLPLKEPNDACLFLLSESRYGQQGRKLLEEARARSKQMRVVLLDPLISGLEIEQTVAKLEGCNAMVVAAFVSVAAYRGNVALGGEYPALMQTLGASGVPIVLVSLGSPYLLRNFPEVSSYLAAYSPAPTAESAVVKALFGEISVTGKLPVTIPGIAVYGDGIVTTKN